ncbi:MAG: glycosyltransferase family 4 protein [Planctomycetota bacterium]|jgi:glycosyltransferase involved in cell wall biosynthesis
MKVLQVHNYYRHPGGEDFAVRDLGSLLQRRGVEVAFLTRHSADLPGGLLGGLKAFVSGFSSASARREMSRILREDPPDLVHVHNLYPLISPAVLRVCCEQGVPVVMTCHNFRLTCPTGLHLADGGPCDRCLFAGEHHCVLMNCRESLLESAAYALRHALARARGAFARRVTLFVALTRFLQERLVEAGFPADRIEVLPNVTSVPRRAADPARGRYAAFVGRVSPEKGIECLLTAAGMLPRLPVRVAGDPSPMPGVADRAPESISFAGYLGARSLARFYRGARFLVLPSICFEVFPLAVAEAMGYGLPVIASRTGGLAEIVEDGVTGLLFEPGEGADLASKMALLWEDPGLCRRMGAAGRQKAIGEFGESVYFERLMAVYQKAIDLAGRQ